jgi:hypothetical protein
MTENELMKLPAVKITWFAPKQIEKTTGRNASRTATAAMSFLACNTFAREVKTAIPDAMDSVDSFYCPNNDSIVVCYRGKFYDADVHPEDRHGGEGGRVRCVFFINEDEATHACYREIFAAIKREKAKTDPSKVGIFEQKPSQEFKN